MAEAEIAGEFATAGEYAWHELTHVIIGVGVKHVQQSMGDGRYEQSELALARAPIEKHKYGSRAEELADSEAILAE